jgi:hypothetical protein
LEADRDLNFDLALTGHSRIVRGKDSLNKAISIGEGMVKTITAAADRGEMMRALLEHMPPPANAPEFILDEWTGMLVRGFEEIELRRQLDMPMLERERAPN